MTAVKVPTRDRARLRELIGTRTPFTTYGALRGAPVNPGEFLHQGQLPPEWWDSLTKAEYVVWSYVTPIAWHVPHGGGWVVPQVRFSTTTTRHQGVCP